MANRQPPVLGQNEPGATYCTRTVLGGICAREGRWHVVWSRNLASVACDPCSEDIRSLYEYTELHPLIRYCTHPAALWYPNEHTCRPPRDGNDIPNGVYLLGK